MTPLIVAIKVGSKYGPEYVNRLAAGVARHTTIPYEFVCLTDNPDGVHAPWAAIETDLPGWWAKLILFKPHTLLAGRRVVFLDLDTVIVGNMDFLLDYDGPFAILRDFYQPEQWGSAIMSIAPGYGQSGWSHFPGTENYWGDQAWIQTCLRHADIWQDLYQNKIVSYKVHCQQGVPHGAAVVCFHGEPKNADLPADHVLRKEWERDATVCSGIL